MSLSSEDFELDYALDDYDHDIDDPRAFRLDLLATEHRRRFRDEQRGSV